jgi:hypothetical protein
MRPHIIYSTFKPGVAFFFVAKGVGHILGYDTTGKQQGFFETPFKLTTVNGIDFSWSRRQERFAVARRTQMEIEFYEWDLLGRLETRQGLSFPALTQNDKNTPYSLYLDGFYNVDSRDAVYQIPGSSRVVVRPYQGKAKTLSFPHQEDAPMSSLYIDVGDVDGDGWKDIVVGSGKGTAPLIQVYNTKGKIIKKIPLQATVGTDGVDVRISQYR